MPLKRLKEEYLEQDGVRFLMEDEAGSTVACRVSHEALRDHGDRMHFSGTDGAVFDAYRELIEEVASEAHDAEGPFDEHGRTDYEVAIEDMIEQTSTKNAPWHLIPTNNKPYGRLAAFTILIDRLGEGLRLGPRPLDPKIAEAAANLFDLSY